MLRRRPSIVRDPVPVHRRAFRTGMRRMYEDGGTQDGSHRRRVHCDRQPPHVRRASPSTPVR